MRFTLSIFSSAKSKYPNLHKTKTRTKLWMRSKIDGFSEATKTSDIGIFCRVLDVGWIRFSTVLISICLLTKESSYWPRSLFPWERQWWWWHNYQHCSPLSPTMGTDNDQSWPGHPRHGKVPAPLTSSHSAPPPSPDINTECRRTTTVTEETHICRCSFLLPLSSEHRGRQH